MKIFVYFLYCLENDDIVKKIDTLEFDPTFEKKKVLWSIEKKKELFDEWKKTPPGVFITIHIDFEPFFCFNELGYEYRRRWLYYKTIDDLQPIFIYNCY